MRITSFLLANAPRYYITQRNNESGQRKGLLNLVFLPVKIHSSRVTIERVCRVRVGEELREEALKNVWEIIQCCPGLVNHVQADCAWHLIDVRVVDLKEKTRFSLTPPGIIFSCWKQQRRNSTLDFLWLHKSFRKFKKKLEKIERKKKNVKLCLHSSYIVLNYLHFGEFFDRIFKAFFLLCRVHSSCTTSHWGEQSEEISLVSQRVVSKSGESGGS